MVSLAVRRTLEFPIIALVLALSLGAAARGQSASAALRVPGAADAAVRATESRPVPSRSERAPTKVTSPSEDLSRAASSDDDEESVANVKFQVSRIVFEGNTVFDDDELRSLARPYERREVTLKQLRALCLKIRAMYRARGHILARAGVPPQRVLNGRVRIAISEGRYGKIKVQGNQHYSEGFVRRFFAPAGDRGIVHQRSVERALIVLNQFPDLSVRSLFEIGKAPGTTDVVLKVADEKPQHVGFDYNNFGNRLVGRNRAGVGVWRGNALRYGDEFFLHATFPFPSESEPFLQTSYTMPVGVDGDRLALALSRAQTKVGEELAVLDIRGEATIGSLTYTLALERTLQANSNMTFGLASKDVKNFIFDNQLVSDDRLREALIGVDRNWVSEHGRTVLSLLATAGLGDDFLGSMSRNDSLSSRPGAGADNTFAKFNLDAVHLHQFSKGTYVLLRFSGQTTTEALTVPEQFVVGGPDSVRGYMQSEYLADDGYSASVELRQLLFEGEKLNIQGVAFLDNGHGSIFNPLIGEMQSRSLTGAGPGLRLSYGKEISLRLDLGFPVSGRLPADDSSVLHAQLTSRF